MSGLCPYIYRQNFSKFLANYHGILWKNREFDSLISRKVHVAYRSNIISDEEIDDHDTLAA